MKHRTTLGDAFKDVFRKLKQEAPKASVSITTKARKLPASGKKKVSTRPSSTAARLTDVRRKRHKFKEKAARRQSKTASVPSVWENIDLHKVYHSEPKRQVRKHRVMPTLAEVSADIRRLKIRAWKSKASGKKVLSRAVAGEGQTVILGLDFGTAFTKAVVRHGQDHYVVDWSHAVTTSSHPFLIPSSFSEHTDGEVVLGSRMGAGWSRHDGIKVRLLADGGATDQEAQIDAVLFIAAAIRYICNWFPSACKDGKHLKWRVHLGLPAESWDDEEKTALFKSLVVAGKRLAFKNGLIERSHARELLLSSALTDSAVDVLPEFACQLYSYLMSPQRQTDLHALMDVGAGTLDVALFNVHEIDETDVLPIFSASVRNLGTHHLIAALAGKKGETLRWWDEHASADNNEVAVKLKQKASEVDNRRGSYLSAVAQAFNDARAEAQKNYPMSPTWHNYEDRLRKRVENGPTLELFLCGGGSRISAIRGRIDRLAMDYRKHGINIKVVPLPLPKDLVGDLPEDQYDRVSVSYGLSQLRWNIADVIRKANLDPLDPAPRPAVEDRDATR